MWKRWADQRHTHAFNGRDQTLTRSRPPTRPIHGPRLSTRFERESLPLLALRLTDPDQMSPIHAADPERIAKP
jgi:hypothetical protein